MKKQNLEIKNEEIRRTFKQLKSDKPEVTRPRLDLYRSNWVGGMDPLGSAALRLAENGIHFIELHDNHYGSDLGYKSSKTMRILADHDTKTAGICRMFSAENDLSSNSGRCRQAAVDYLESEIEFTQTIGGGHNLVVPDAAGCAKAYDESEFQRSTGTHRLVVLLFQYVGIKAAIEPIRAAEVSFCHTVSEAKEYIETVNHSGVKYINGDVYHMQSEEKHIGQAILDAGEMLINLHMADSNRCALGDGAMDIDTIIMTLYLIGFNRSGCFVTPEPLGPGGNPYPAMFGNPDEKLLDTLVRESAKYWRERENIVTALYQDDIICLKPKR